MFLGSYQVKISSGRRVAVPSSFRSLLGENFILARWYEGCLVLIGKDSWQALLKRLTGDMKVVTAPVRDTERFIFGSAYEVVSDEQGRIVIPERLSLYAGIADEVFFVGLGDRIEIWAKDTWIEKEERVAKEAPLYIEELGKK